MASSNRPVQFMSDWISSLDENLFFNEYIVKSQLGQPGQYGVAYQCQRKSDGQYFAVKCLNKNRFYRISHRQRYRYLQAMHREVDILKTLNHRNIIGFEDVYEDKTTLYIVMEECKGGELLIVL